MPATPGEVVAIDEAVVDEAALEVIVGASIVVGPVAVLVAAAELEKT